MIEVASLFAQTSRCCVTLSAVLCDPTAALCHPTPSLGRKAAGSGAGWGNIMLAWTVIGGPLRGKEYKNLPEKTSAGTFPRVNSIFYVINK